MLQLQFRFRRTFTFAALLSVPAALVAQTATIKGRVTSDAGAPLVAVTVSIPGLGVGTASGNDGQYTFTVPASRVTGQSVTLNARRVGYAPQNAAITLSPGAIVHDFVLDVAARQLDQVIVTGAGTSQVRERVGSIINTVDSSMITRATQPQNILSSLTASAPNVRVSTQSGEPGASAFVMIRGATSVTGTNQPLDRRRQSADRQHDAVDERRRRQHRHAESRGRHQSERHRVRADPEGRRRVGDLWSARGQRRHSHHDQEGRQRPDALLDHVDADVRQRGQDGAAANRLRSGKRRQGRRVHDAGLQRDEPDLGTATRGRHAGVQPRQRDLSPGAHERQRDQRLRRQRAHDVLSVGRSHRPAWRDEGRQQPLRPRHGEVVGGASAPQHAHLRRQLLVLHATGEYVQKGSNTSGLLLGALRTPPDFNNLPFLDPVSGLQRSYRFPNPTAASITDSRGYDNPFFVLDNPGNRSELGRFLGHMTANWVPTAWLSVDETFGADNYTDSRVEAIPLTSSSDPVGNVTRFQITNLEIDHNLTATLSHAVRDELRVAPRARPEPELAAQPPGVRLRRPAHRADAIRDSEHRELHADGDALAPAHRRVLRRRRSSTSTISST